MKEKHGEFIHIYWDELCNDVEYVKGHVTLDEGIAAAEKYFGVDDTPRFVGMRHLWARWIPSSHYSDFTMLLVTMDGQKRGAFPVTELNKRYQS